MPELILTLRERELARLPITAVRTTIGRDASADLVIDNAGISRLHAEIEAVGDSFVLKDCNSENGITLNGEACREGRLVHGDVIGLNKFLIRFSNQALAVPENLQRISEKPASAVPQDVQRTLHLDAGSAQAFAEVAKQQIARQRAELAARGGDSLGPPPESKPRPPAEPMAWEEPNTSNRSVVVFVGGVIVGGALIAGLIAIAF